VTDDHRSTPHAEHDPTLVAAYAAGDTGEEADAGSALVARCAECAALDADLRALELATRTLPPPARTRDFRLTPEQARANRPRWYRGFLAPFAGSSQPRRLGALLVTIGLAGILIGLLPGTPAETFQGFGRDLGLGAIPGLGGTDQVAGAPEATDQVAGAPEGTAGVEVVPGIKAPCSSLDSLLLGPLVCPAPTPSGEYSAMGRPSASPGASDDGRVSASSAPDASVAPEGAQPPTSVAPAPSGQVEREAVTTRLGRDDRPFLILSGIILLVGTMILGLVIAARRLGIDEG
jgi:hypothetical protein